jgi:predicted esterase
MGNRVLAIGLLLLTLTSSTNAAQTEKTPWWSADVEQALKRAGNARAELEKALNGVPASQRKGIAFLIANMPDRDLRSLHADFLLENVALAFKVRDEVPWGRAVPEDIFLNDVLAYVNLDETREPWRKPMMELCLPLVKDCKTPTEAAQKLNATIFTRLKVKYSTERKKANQSPKESMDSGLASCSGLSVLLSDACRSVCVPARLAGTPMWTNNRGNHTWVEVWDGRWYFTGAAEFDPKGLDRGWFVGDAAKAKKDEPGYAIYAASFRRTKVHFPLVWDRDSCEVSAENVTDRYTATSKLSKDQVGEVEKAAKAFFEADAEKRAQWKFDDKLERLLIDNEEAVREAVWNAYREAGIHAESKKDYDANQVHYQKHVSPYVVRKVGKRPAGGWPLFIAMHGGGGAPKAVNDGQWKHMQIYYRDHPGDAGYLYLALRAPNDTWNGFYDNYVPPLVINLIRQQIQFGDVDPDKVFLMGYSHGGYGAFFIGPKVPDRFAAVHASAAAPTDGTISAKTLRNMRFTFMIGEKDTAYGRAERCQKFNAVVEKLQKDNPSEFPVKMEWIANAGHGGLPDRDKIKELIAYRRESMPRHLSWDLTDSVIDSFYWLSVAKPAPGRSIDAKLTGNAVTITTRDVKEFSLELDARLVRYDLPLTITLNGKAREVALRPSLRTLCESLHQRGDPRLAHSCKVTLR